MAATATEQVIHNGSRNLVLKYTIAGTTGDTTAAKLLDRDSLSVTKDLKLSKVTWALTGCSVNLLWDATSNVSFFECSEGEGSQDFTDIGGIPNNAGAGKTGDVVYTTTGYGAGGDGGHVILEFKKDNPVVLSFGLVLGAGSMSLTGAAPTTIRDGLREPGAGSLTITGAAPTPA